MANTLIYSESGKEGTMKLVYGNYYSFTRLWYVVIWGIYLTFVVKISKKLKIDCVYYSVNVTLIEPRIKIKSRVDMTYSCKWSVIPVCNK